MNIISEYTMRDHILLQRALSNAVMSRDPNTKVGSVIIPANPYMAPIHGWNRLPDNIAATHARLHDRDTKLKLIVHAEMDAILSAARDGISIGGGTLYLAATDETGEVWGGPPCTRCTVEIIQSGIKRIVSYPQKPNSKWTDDLNYARALLREAKVELIEREPLLSYIKEQVPCISHNWRN